MSGSMDNNDRIASLERRIAELDAFNYTVAHQLRAPLLAMSGFARAVEEREGDRLSPKARTQLRRAISAALGLERLIDDLLTLARAAHMPLQKQPLAVDEIVRDVVRDLRQAYPATRVVVSELPMIYGDPVVVRQVFVNVIGNALKYSHLAPEPLVEVGLGTTGEFIVRDNGIGFAQDKAHALFTPFERMTGDPAYPGTGVGLAIVKRLIERHGGCISARSRPGGPTEFSFSFGDPD